MHSATTYSGPNMTDAEAELKRRRDRARVAQGAFRKRQAQAQKDLQSKHDRMQEAIRSILAEMQRTDRPELRRKVICAAEVAGIDVSEFSSCQTGEAPSSSSYEGILDFGRELSKDVIQSTTWQERAAEDCFAIPRTPPSVTGNRHRAPQNTNSIAFADPHQYLGVVGLPDEMLPFLGPGAYTFRGRLVWYVLERAFAEHDHKTHLIPPSSDSSSVNRDSPNLASQGTLYRGALNIGDAIKQAPSDDARLRIYSLISLLKTRLYGQETEKREKYPKKVLMWTAEMQRLVDDEYARQKELPVNWLDPSAAEQRIRAILGAEVFAVLCDAAKESWKVKQVTRSSLEGVGDGMIDGLLEALYQSYKCFGNGPRWNTVVLDGVVMRWAMGLTSGCA